MLMGVPLLVLYEISVVAVWIFGRKKLKYASQPEPEDDAAEEQEVESAVEK
jgi:Sec-independent protein secretion pathway component TatC